MSLASDIITAAYRESNIIPLVGTPNTNQNTEALYLLNVILLSSIGNEIGKSLIDLNVGGLYDESRVLVDWVPPDARLVFNISAARTIVLDPEPSNGQRLAFVDAAGNLATYPVTLNGNGRKIEGVTSLVLNVNSDSRNWIYRSDTGAWAKVTTLLLTDQMPFPQEFDDYFTTVLAMRLNPRYGIMVSAETVEALKRGRRNIRARYASNTETFPEYIGIIGEMRGHYYNSGEFGRGFRWPR